MKIDRREQGFTLVELMLVVCIIGILAAVALPAYQEYTGRARRAERFLLVEPARQALSVFYDRWGRFPKSNAEAGLPVSESFRGALVKSVEVREGIILPTLKSDQTNSDASTDDCLSTYRPVVFRLNPTGTLGWIRDADRAPEGFDFDLNAKDIRSFSATKLCPAK